MESRQSRSRSPIETIDLCTPESSPKASPKSSPESSLESLLESSLESSLLWDIFSDFKLVEEPKSYECPVCLELAFHRKPAATSCGHVFCNDCISTALRDRPKCPVCNKELGDKKLIRLHL